MGKLSKRFWHVQHSNRRTREVKLLQADKARKEKLPISSSGGDFSTQSTILHQDEIGSKPAIFKTALNYALPQYHGLENARITSGR